MTTLLLDTNVVSYLLKGDSRAAGYEPLLIGHRLALSFVTVGELFEWAALRGWGTARTTRLEQSLAAYLTIPVDVEVCRLWADVRVQRRSIGRPIASQDAWIAATALRHQLPLVTHDAVDFDQIAGLDVRTVLSP